MASVILAAALGCTEGDRQPATPTHPIANGVWHATLTVPGGTIPFRFALSGAPDSTTALLINGEETVPIGEVSRESDRLTLHFPAFNSTITASLENGVLMGRLRLIKRGGVPQDIPLRAVYTPGNRAERPEWYPAFDLSGRWNVTFVDDDGVETKAVGEFRQDGLELTGTFLTPTGDYRYLSGKVDPEPRLSCFDGAHAYLFKAKRRDDGTLAGDFWSGTKWHETWTARRDPDVRLPDPDSLTAMREGYETLAFTFPDTDGHDVSLEDERFRDKVVIVSIAGSWCPNCNDETAFLARFYDRYRDRGVEVVGLMYEHYREFDRAATQVDRFREKHRVGYPLLVAGYSDKEEAAKTLPMLERFMSFPTLIVLDRAGAVRRIYTGFSGPGTGPYYDEFKTSFTGSIEALLSE